MFCCMNCLLLLLALMTGTSASKREQDKIANASPPHGPISVQLTGVDVLTVGIPYGFLCTAACTPPCVYTWTWDGQVAYGAEFPLLLKSLVPAQVLTCEARNPSSGMTATNSKSLLVTEGPSNIRIKGPGMLSQGVSATFTCSAVCSPPCTYSWIINSIRQNNSTSDIHVRPAYVNSVSLVCEARNTISGLFAAVTLNVWVASGPEQMQISGPSTVNAGSRYNFLCMALCIPSCDFTWFFKGKTFSGNFVYLPILSHGIQLVGSKLVMPISEMSKEELLECKAVNTISDVSGTVKKTLTLYDPFSVKPVSQSPPIAKNTFSLQCVGVEGQAHIQWIKDDVAITTDNRLQLSNRDTTLTFNPLLHSDDGVYQCVVSEGGNVIPSFTYLLKVNYGPLQVMIVQTDKGTVGQQVPLLPGSMAKFRCEADCYPTCIYTWIHNVKLVATNSNFTLSPVNFDDGGPLTCVAYNTITKTNGIAETMLVLIGEH